MLYLYSIRGTSSIALVAVLKGIVCCRSLLYPLYRSVPFTSFREVNNSPLYWVASVSHGRSYVRGLKWHSGCTCVYCKPTFSTSVYTVAEHDTSYVLSVESRAFVSIPAMRPCLYYACLEGSEASAALHVARLSCV